MKSDEQAVQTVFEQAVQSLVPPPMPPVSSRQPSTDPVQAIEDMADLKLVFGDETLMVHSVVLGLASPAFAAFLSHDMKESRTRSIELPGKSRTDFELFVNYLRPGSRARVTAAIVDTLLPLADEYQVQALKEECEQVLLSLPCTAARLVQAKERKLDAQYQRCLQDLCMEQFLCDFEHCLANEREVLLDLLPHMARKVPCLRLLSEQFANLAAGPRLLGNLLPTLRVTMAYPEGVDERFANILRGLADPDDHGKSTANAMEFYLIQTIGKKRMQQRILQVANKTYQHAVSGANQAAMDAVLSLSKEL